MSEIFPSKPFTTNRAAVLVSAKQLEIRDEGQAPEPGPNDIMVNVVSSGICGSDVSSVTCPFVLF